ncbi:MAG TPA: antibiotic biosynthesis monooxygenase [Candidatus Sulfomarinibacteraceae bacterium]|nr:antibiotic biosynthesis monooxygenase [Candidatus Sulfomarinibacteraceae bacterium]
MSEPLIVISTFRVKEGKLEDLRRYYKKVIEIVESNEPQLIAFHGFINEDGTEMTSIQVHPDTASMDFHMQVLRENWDESFSEYGQVVDNISTEYYGAPPKSALDLDDIDVQSEQGLTLKPLHIAGFTRSTAAQNALRMQLK